MQEIEAKILEIDIAVIQKKLESLGAKLIFSQTKLESFDFDHQKLRIRKKRHILRLRRRHGKKEGELTFKGPRGNNIFKEREEVNIKVDDFDKMLLLLKRLGFFVCRYQEKLREEWEFGSCKIEIDTYPGIPTYIEIEGPAEEKIIEIAERLGFKKEDLKNWTTTEVLRYYSLPMEGERSISHLVFKD